MQCDLNRLTEVFNKMKADGVDYSRELNWSFYFIHDDKYALQKLYDELKGHSYKLDKLEKINETEWQLVTSKQEILEPEKLHRRNIAFNELAEYCSVNLYDGWDVSL